MLQVACNHCTALRALPHLLAWGHGISFSQSTCASLLHATLHMLHRTGSQQWCTSCTSTAALLPLYKWYLTFSGLEIIIFRCYFAYFAVKKTLWTYTSC